MTTAHGVIETPAFVPVATQATVRAVSGGDLEKIGTQVIIANAYHLHLMPGEEVIKKMGGLHRFAGWRKPVITDSGGFQVFSLGAAKEHGVGKIASIFPEGRVRGGHLGSRRRKQFVKIGEDGVEFTSYLDGSQHRFTPESVIQLEMKLGADIILVLDECTSPLHDYEYTMAAMERTHRWAVRALEEYRRIPRRDRAIFGIIQGGAYRDLREKSAEFIGSRAFHGFAIGGSLGKSKEEMYQVLEWTLPLLSHERPRHLLGVGMVEDVFDVVSQGIDLFDCVAPTRMARSGTVFVRGAKRYRIHLLNAKYREDRQPIDESCACPTCKRYSRAYLRHLFAAKEQTGERLAAVHNLYFTEEMMREIRKAIREKRFEAFRGEWER
jgi:queuine tRNA-ribosyltransferase/7-cyano-7-deazaguanine tRNA-ribosyltransferase